MDAVELVVTDTAEWKEWVGVEEASECVLLCVRGVEGKKVRERERKQAEEQCALLKGGGRGARYHLIRA